MSRLTSLFSSAAFRTLLIVLCFTVACVLSHRLFLLKDMTATGHHTLKPQSVATLAQFTDPLDVEVFINPQDPQLESITNLLEKYRTRKTDINITVSDPALDPQRMRQLDVAPGGEIFMRYESRTQRLTQVSEQSLTSAMQRLVRTKNHNILFTSGHGERAINSNTNADLGIFTQQLSNSGFIVDTVNLSTQGSLNPDNGTLVIAGPLHRFLANEVVLLLDYISKGGNLIWLTEPDSDDGLKSVAIELGIERLPGVVIDMAAQQLQIERPDFAVANDYFRHQATRGFSEITLFPQASGLAFKADREWQVAPLVHSTEQSWTETGALSGQVEYGDDTQEVSGPIPLVFALERDVADKKQRVIVAGDGDFLADAWIANGGNRDLGNRLFNWSVGDTAMITLNTPLETDTKLDLSRSGMFLLAGTSLLFLPGLLFTVATGVWYRRQHG